MIFQHFKCWNTHIEPYIGPNWPLDKRLRISAKVCHWNPQNSEILSKPFWVHWSLCSTNACFFPPKTLVLWHLKKSFWVSRLGGTLLPVGRKKVLTPPDTPESRPSVKHGIGVLYAKRTCAIPAAVSVSEWWRILLPPCAPSLRALFARQSYRPIHVPTSPRHQWSVAACRITAVTRIGAAAAGFRANLLKTHYHQQKCGPMSPPIPLGTGPHFPCFQHSTWFASSRSPCMFHSSHSISRESISRNVHPPPFTDGSYPKK